MSKSHFSNTVAHRPVHLRMESSKTYRALAAKFEQGLWMADSIDRCLDVEFVVAQCAALADRLEAAPSPALTVGE